MMGSAEAQWHLELVCDPALLAKHPPSAEDLLVLYLGAEIDEAWLDRIWAAEGKRIEAHNPYWETWGITILRSRWVPSRPLDARLGTGQLTPADRWVRC